MSRSVPPWLWSVLIRDFGPRIANVRLVLHTLRSFMNKTGETFVSQKVLADAACLSAPTVRKSLLIAWESKWLGVGLHGRTDQGWRHYQYTACIPDHLQIPKKHERLVDHFGAIHGEVDTETHPDRVNVGKPVSHVSEQAFPGGASKGHPGNGSETVEREKNETPKVGKPRSERGKNDTKKVGNGFSTKSSSAEVLKKLSPEEGPSLTRRTLSSGSEFQKTDETDENGMLRVRSERIRECIKKWPAYSNAEIAKVAVVTLQEVNRIRANGAAP